MRDVGVLVWVTFLIVGVIGSMVSSLRKSQTQRRSQPVPPQWVQRFTAAVAPPAAPPARPAPAKPAPAPPPKPAAASAPEHPLPWPERRAVRRLFAGKSDLVRAVIAAEVLGKPRGLSDEYLPH